MRQSGKLPEKPGSLLNPVSELAATGSSLLGASVDASSSSVQIRYSIVVEESPVYRPKPQQYLSKLWIQWTPTPSSRARGIADHTNAWHSPAFIVRALFLQTLNKVYETCLEHLAATALVVSYLKSTGFSSQILQQGVTPSFAIRYGQHARQDARPVKVYLVGHLRWRESRDIYSVQQRRGGVNMMACRDRPRANSSSALSSLR